VRIGDHIRSAAKADLGADLAVAQFFEFSEDLCYLGEELAVALLGDRQKFELGQRFLRLPYPKCWLEIILPPQSFLSRVAFFARELQEEAAGAVMAFWQTRDGIVSVAKEDFLYGVFRTHDNYKPTVENFFRFCPPFYDRLSWRYKIDPGRRSRCPNFSDDIEGSVECGLIQIFAGAIALLNTRNGLSIETENLERLNRARARCHKYPLIEYRRTSLLLSRVQSRRVALARNGDSSVRCHEQRGHYKLRRSGLWWWIPHWRGDPKRGVIMREQYDLRR